MLSVYIADDYFLIREGLKRSLSGVKDIQVVGEAAQMKTIIPSLVDLQPDVLLLEMNLCERSIKDLLMEVQDNCPATKTIIISDCNCELPVVLAIRSGISGFIRKNISKEELIKAIRTVSAGQSYYCSDIAQLLVNGILSDQPSTAFSDRELEVLSYICKGRSNEQIGDLLFLSEKTIATHRRNIMKKAGVKKTSDLIIWALDKNLLVKT